MSYICELELKTCVMLTRDAFQLKLLGVFFFILTFSAAIAQPEFDWVNTYSTGQGTITEPLSSALDNDGNIIIVGQMRGAIDFDADAAYAIETSGSSSREIPYIAKYSPNGDLIWVNSFPANGNSRFKDVTLDATGNIYVSGTFLRVLKLDPDDPSFEIVSTEENESDALVASYAPNGGFRWGFGLEGPGTEDGSSIAYNNGQVIVSGAFSQTLDLDPTAGITQVSTPGGQAGGQQMFVAAYNAADGGLNYGFSIEGTLNFDLPFDITTDDADNYYITGRFRGTKDFDPGAGLSSLTTSGNDDIFVSSYTSAGAFRWVFKVGVSGADEGRNIVWRNGNLYLLGLFTFNPDFDPGAGSAVALSNGFKDIFFARYDDDGNFINVLTYGTSGNDDCRGIAADDNDNLYIGGRIAGTIDLNPNGVQTDFVSQSTDSFVASYNSAMELNWYQQVSTNSFSEPISVHLNASGEVFGIGAAQGLVDLDANGSGLLFDQSNPFTKQQFIYRCDASGVLQNGWMTSPLEGGDDVVNHIVGQPDGSSFVGGSYEGGQLFLETGEQYVATTGPGAFIAKQNPQGETGALVNFHGTVAADVRALDVDANGNLYGALFYRGDLTMEVNGVPTVFTANVNNLPAMLLVRFDNNLNLVWSKTFLNQTAIQVVSDLDVEANALVVTGHFTGDLELAPGTVLTDNGNDEVFLAKFDLDGNLIWGNSFGSTSNDSGEDVHIGQDEKIYLVAKKRFDVNFDPAGAAPVLAGDGGFDLAFVAYNPDGSFIWAQQGEGSNVQVGGVSSTENGSMLVYAEYSGTATYGEGANAITLTSDGFKDLMLLKFLADGTIDFGFTAVTGTSAEEAGDVVLSGDSLIVTGELLQTGSLNSSDGGSTPYDLPSAHAFYASYDTSGVLLNSFIFNTTQGQSEAFDVDVAGDGLYIAGRFAQLFAVTDPVTPEQERLALSDDDGFAVRFGPSIEAQPCVGDFNNDGNINAGDLLILLSEIGCVTNCVADLTGDGSVGVSDVLDFLSIYATQCP